MKKRFMNLTPLDRPMAEVEAGHQETFIQWKKRSRAARPAPQILGGIY